jgi:glutamyl-Q tRNA(Asp) synthetase
MKVPVTLRPHNSTSYRGRFAPSPSGSLHFGSLVAALASFLDAKSNQGKWLVRIEDIDPPREKVGASAAILSTLACYGLHWDEEVLYQSKQSTLYDEVLNGLKSADLSYHCQCTRADIKKIGGIYPGTCKSKHICDTNSAIRLINHHGIFHFQDLIQGQVNTNQAIAAEDFILLRKDGLFAYQLAVVVDDIFQGISHVIRGCDLLEPSARQLSFYETLQCSPPKFGHFPIAATEKGFKLSKQNKATAIDNKNPIPSLVQALVFLGQQPPEELAYASVDELLNWAIYHWSINKIPKQKEIVL